MPPANISVTATSADTIFITWGEVPEQARHGIIRNYGIIVKYGDLLVQKTFVNASVMQTEMANLAENSYYCVQLLAYTVKEGLLSECVNVTTLIKGKESGS